MALVISDSRFEALPPDSSPARLLGRQCATVTPIRRTHLGLLSQRTCAPRNRSERPAACLANASVFWAVYSFRLVRLHVTVKSTLQQSKPSTTTVSTIHKTAAISIVIPDSRD